MSDAEPSKPIGPATVAAKTGKTWPEWFALLDATGAAQMTHQEIVAILRDQYHVGPWWQQMVTVTYEQARGLRQKYQASDGYQVSVNKTIAVPLEQLAAAWETPAQRARWLPTPELDVTAQTALKSMRITWADGKSRVEVNFTRKGEAKSQVSVQHNHLADAAQVEEMRAYWANVLAALQKLLQGEA